MIPPLDRRTVVVPYGATLHAERWGMLELDDIRRSETCVRSGDCSVQGTHGAKRPDFLLAQTLLTSSPQLRSFLSNSITRMCSLRELPEVLTAMAQGHRLGKAVVNDFLEGLA